MKKVKCSVIINSFNRPNFLKHCLDGLRKQSDPHFDAYIMDDGSCDEVQDVMNDFVLVNGTGKYQIYSSDVKDDDRLKSARYAVLINKALRKIKEDDGGWLENRIIMYLTDDSFYGPDKINYIRKFFTDFPDQDVVYNITHLYQVKLKEGFIKKPKHRQQIGVAFDEKRIRKAPEYNFIDHISLAHRATCLEDIEEPWWEEGQKAWHNGDWLFWIKLLDEGNKFNFIPRVLDEKYHHDKCVQFQSTHGEGITTEIKSDTIME